MSTPLVLRTSIGKYDHVQALRDGTVGSERVRFDFVEVEPISAAFRRMLRDWEFDFCEMAFTTHAMAHAYEKPIVGLPIVLMRGFHHGALHCAKQSPLKGPADLAGKKVAVRAYSQTTGVWVRGILQSEYGLDAGDVTWVTLEDAHVREYVDPPNVMRAAEGKTLRSMLLAGEVDATLGLAKPDPNEVRTVIPDAEEAAFAWYRKTRIYPANHIVALKRELAARHPWLPTELYRLFAAAKQTARDRGQERKAAPAGSARARLMAMIGDDPLPYGATANRAPMELALKYAAQQKLIPRAYGLDELLVPELLAST